MEIRAFGECPGVAGWYFSSRGEVSLLIRPGIRRMPSVPYCLVEWAHLVSARLDRGEQNMEIRAFGECPGVAGWYFSSRGGVSLLLSPGIRRMLSVPYCLVEYALTEWAPFRWLRYYTKKPQLSLRQKKRKHCCFLSKGAITYSPAFAVPSA